MHGLGHGVPFLYVQNRLRVSVSMVLKRSSEKRRTRISTEAGVAARPAYHFENLAKQSIRISVVFPAGNDFHQNRVYLIEQRTVIDASGNPIP